MVAKVSEAENEEWVDSCEIMEEWDTLQTVGHESYQVTPDGVGASRNIKVERWVVL